MRWPAHECRRMIQDLRAAFYQKSYNEQNYVLLGLMEVRVCPTGCRTITYKVPKLGTVCRGAFQICYGFSHRKLQVLLKKLEVDGVSIQQDMRGRHENNAMRLLPEARRAVTDFICSKGRLNLTTEDQELENDTLTVERLCARCGDNLLK